MNFYLYSYFVHVISLIWIYIDFFYRFQELLFKKEMKLFNLYVIFCTPNKIFKMVLLSKQQCLFWNPRISIAIAHIFLQHCQHCPHPTIFFILQNLPYFYLLLWRSSKKCIKPNPYSSKKIIFFKARKVS